MRQSRSASPRRNYPQFHRFSYIPYSYVVIPSSFVIRISSFSEHPSNPWFPPSSTSVAISGKPQKIVRILLAGGGANQIQAPNVQLERSSMKKIPHTLGNVEQKETKLTNVSFVRAVPQILISFVAFYFPVICLSFICVTSFAQTPDSVAEREVQRRQATIPQGEEALARAKSAMKEKNYTLAHEEFRTALTYLPDAIVSGKAHDQAVDGFCKSGVALAEARIAEGR